MFFTHKIIFRWGGVAAPPKLSDKAEQQLGPTVTIAGNKKAPTRDEKGRQNGCALLIFPKLMMPELELAPDIETKVQPVAVVSLGQSLDHSS
jgi:hypothetical protein